MIILGFNGLLYGDVSTKRNGIFIDNLYVHDSSAALVIDGKLTSAISEERFTRVKHEGIYPKNAIKNILDAEKITRFDIDVICYVDNGSLPGYFSQKTRHKMIKSILKDDFPNSKIKIIDHHYAHAWSSFGVSNFSEANVLTFDHAGDNFIKNNNDNFQTGYFNNFSFSTFKKNPLTIDRHYFNLIPSAQQFFSFGYFYTSCSYLIYQMLYKEKEDEDKPAFGEGYEGKIMGLSAYGSRHNVKIPNPFDIIQPTKYDFPVVYLKNNVGETQATPEDFAAWMQNIFEITLLEFFERMPQRYKHENLCLSGGCALNILANSLLLKKGVYKNIFIGSAPNDDGLSLGAALSEAYEKEKIINIPSNVGSLGFWYNSAIIEKSIDLKNKNKNFTVGKYDDYVEFIDEVANLLLQETGICWFHGRSEFGPRALGNRSILVNPMIDSKDFLNTQVKHREYWRPYAGIVLKEYVHDFFDIPTNESPYMMFSSTVKKNKRNLLPGITHKDNTCRIQTLDRDFNPTLYDLINKFKDKTGVPVLLNTSFNTLKNEPIVETPSDAIESFIHCKLKVLVIENYIIIKK